MKGQCGPYSAPSFPRTWLLVCPACRLCRAQAGPRLAQYENGGEMHASPCRLCCACCAGRAQTGAQRAKAWTAPR